MNKAIFFVDGNKGGVGKSLFAKVLLHHLAINEVDLLVVDADNNHDVANVYPGRTDISFTISPSEAQSDPHRIAKVDAVFEAALEKPVVVNLPANVHRHVADWIEENDIIDLCQANEILLGKWFLSNGSYHSVSLFVDSVKEFEGKLPHIFVRNQGLCPDWSNLKQHKPFQDIKKKYRFEEIEFPLLRFAERDFLEQHEISFLEALTSPANYGLPILSQQRLTKFLREAGNQMKTCQLLSSLKGYEGLVDLPASFGKAEGSKKQGAGTPELRECFEVVG